MANTSSAKGNPASTRMSNPKYKAKRVSNLANQNGKIKGDGKIGNSNSKNYKDNQINHENAVHNAQILNEVIGAEVYDKIGLRELRRILNGKRGDYTEVIDKLLKANFIGVDLFGYSVAHNARKSYNLED